MLGAEKVGCVRVGSVTGWVPGGGSSVSKVVKERNRVLWAGKYEEPRAVGANTVGQETMSTEIAEGGEDSVSMWGTLSCGRWRALGCLQSKGEDWSGLHCRQQ